MPFGKTTASLLVPICCTAGFSPAAFATSHADLRARQTGLNIIWEVSPSASDKMSTASRSEAALFPTNGQVYYAPRYSDSTRNPLYRLATSSDHMDSTSSSEGGYSLEGILANPWKAASKPSGSTRMIRGYDSSSGDHALMSDSLTFGGYGDESLSDRYAYPRDSAGTLPS
ncbi:hypothetical protein [Cohnella zeiphila]|uniref:Uncharacterized protein n=1 Tax=Cohnella zeiphila TaxID=2761120 RepID=A0A7X0VVQ7_9BACL|nr:hypothetical protein [Cohnella zeiphila]MBB6731680.1 hypothetical protein [Cohnella zeiphila]